MSVWYFKLNDNYCKFNKFDNTIFAVENENNFLNVMQLFSIFLLSKCENILNDKVSKDLKTYSLEYILNVRDAKYISEFHTVIYKNFISNLFLRILTTNNDYNFTEENCLKIFEVNKDINTIILLDEYFVLYKNYKAYTRI